MMHYIAVASASDALLIREAREMPIRPHPRDTFDGWRGIALLEYARRHRMPLPKRWERAAMKGADLVAKYERQPIAFRMLALSVMASYQVMIIRFMLEPASMPSLDDMVASFTPLIRR